MSVDSSPAVAFTSAEQRHLVEVRRHLHRHPELRFDEVKTGRYLTTLLAPIADRIEDAIGGTGILVTIRGAQNGPHVLLRADMDAYPVTETGETEYRSTVDGVSHACGHDAHMTVMYGAFRRLAEMRPPRGQVSVLFQPAEEIPFGQKSGARAVLQSDRLERRYDAVLGLHCWPALRAGAIGVDHRIAMAAKDAFKIDVTGVGAHAAMPAHGRDAVLALSSLVEALHATLSRRRSPQEMVAFNIGTIAGGASQSQVALAAFATGTLRTHDEGVRLRLKQVIEQVCAGVAIQQDVAVELTWSDEMPSVVNATSLVDLALRDLDDLASVQSILTPPMTSDDFALLGALGPLLYLKLGIARSDAADTPSLHSPYFDIDESCLGTGVRVMERLARTVLSSDERKSTQA